MNIKTPPMPETPSNLLRYTIPSQRELIAAELAELFAARDQQWIEMVRPVVEAAERVLDWLDSPSDSALSDSEMEALRAALSQIKGE